MSAASMGAKQEEVDENEGDESVVTEESIKETNKEKKKDNKEKVLCFIYFMTLTAVK